DVMRLLWRDQKPLEEDGFERAVVSICDVGDFFERYVHGTDPLPHQESFGALGVSFESAPVGAGLGANVRSDGGRLFVVSAIRGGAAMRAGLLPGDEIMSIDGTRTTSEAEVKSVIASLDEGTAVEMLVSRGGVVRPATLVVAADPRVKITLRAAGESPLRERWLRRTND
ncbi:MAG TPA: PDZ domain-containing protein, partial [Thermoanaerobaculia bacterium]